MSAAIVLTSTYANTTLTYDTYGNRLTEQDPRGNTRSWAYDAAFHSLPVTETYPPVGGLTMQESAAWDFGAGKITSHTDVNGQATTYEHDTFKRLTKVVKPGDTSASPSVEHRYNAWGTVNQQNLETRTKVSAGDVLWSKQLFDGLGRVVQVQARGETEGATTFTIVQGTTDYSNRGLVDRQYVPQNLDSTTVRGYKAPEASWKSTAFAYDGIGRVTQQTNPDGTTVSHAYTDWQTETTNERGFKKRFINDAFGRLAKVEELDASHALYATTTYAYNVLGRKTQMTDPDMGTWRYGYDLSGNLTSQTDAKAQDIAFEYDALDRLTRKCNPSCTGTVLATYTYDASSPTNFGKGRRTGVSDTSGTLAYEYDSHGRLAKETRTVDSVAFPFQYAYDGADRVTSVTYPTGEAVTTGYNGRGLPLTLSGTIAGSLVTDARYNQLGALTQLDLGNGLRTEQHYHGLDAVDAGDATGFWGRLYRIRTTKISDGAVRQHVKHWWDAAGNLTTWKDVAQGRTVDYTYDFLDRLTGGSGFFSLSVTYNTIGNILNMNGTAYTYGSSKPHAVTLVEGAMTHAYDANGNATTFGGGSTISWDVENRMTTMTDDNGTQSFVYDADGWRVKRTRGAQTVVYPSRYYEKNMSTGLLTTYYYFGDRLVTLRKGGVNEWVQLDHLGSITGSADPAGAQVADLTYGQWGKVVGWASSGTLGTDRKYTQQRDEDVAANVDLYYYGARYYEPGIGRFLSADPVVPNPANPQSLNRYSYVLNNPLRYTDPSGLTLMPPQFVRPAPAPDPRPVELPGPPPQLPAPPATMPAPPASGPAPLSLRGCLQSLRLVLN